MNTVDRLQQSRLDDQRTTLPPSTPSNNRHLNAAGKPARLSPLNEQFFDQLVKCQVCSTMFAPELHWSSPRNRVWMINVLFFYQFRMIERRRRPSPRPRLRPLRRRTSPPSIPRRRQPYPMKNSSLFFVACNHLHHVQSHRRQSEPTNICVLIVCLVWSLVSSFLFQFIVSYSENNRQRLLSTKCTRRQTVIRTSVKLTMAEHRRLIGTIWQRCVVLNNLNRTTSSAVVCRQERKANASLYLFDDVCSFRQPTVILIGTIL